MGVGMTLVGAGLLMGLVGSPHCAGMCGAACSGIIQRVGKGRSALSQTLVLLTSRTLSYAVGGALAAGSLGTLRAWSEHVVLLRPFWVLLQCAALFLGLWLLVRGSAPRWPVPKRLGGPEWQPVESPTLTRPILEPWCRVAASGALWVAWPCGLLHSALLVASIAPGPGLGAAVMMAFALSSSVALGFGTFSWRGNSLGRAVQRATWTIRLSGAMLIISAVWTLMNSVQSSTGFC